MSDTVPAVTAATTDPTDPLTDPTVVTFATVSEAGLKVENPVALKSATPLTEALATSSTSLGVGSVTILMASSTTSADAALMTMVTSSAVISVALN